MNRYTVSNFTCRDLAIASILGAIKTENYFIYLFLASLFINWRENIPLVQDEVLRLMGYTLCCSNSIELCKNVFMDERTECHTFLIELSKEAAEDLLGNSNKYDQNNFTVIIENYDNKSRRFVIKYPNLLLGDDKSDLFITCEVTEKRLVELIQITEELQQNMVDFMFLCPSIEFNQELSSKYILSIVKNTICPENNMFFDIINRHQDDLAFFSIRILTIRRCYYGSMFVFMDYVSEFLINYDNELRAEWELRLQQIIRERDNMINIVYMDALRKRINLAKYREVLVKEDEAIIKLLDRLKCKLHVEDFSKHAYVKGCVDCMNTGE